MTQEEYDSYIASKNRICVLCGASHTVAAPQIRGLFCPKCRTPRLDREADRVRTYIGKARRLNLPATLTILEWLHILNHFEWKCAYCGKANFEVMEHIISMTRGGGTTADNVVPACLGCNSHKDRIKRPGGFTMSMHKINQVKSELMRALETAPRSLSLF